MGATTNVEAAGQRAFGGDAAFGGGAHGFEEGDDARFDLGLGRLGGRRGDGSRAIDGGGVSLLIGAKEGELVGHDELGDGEMLAAASESSSSPLENG